MAKKQEQVAEVEPDQQSFNQAVSDGKKLIEEGKTKVEAAMAIYRILAGQPQETIVKAFIAGASLTEKGALTYWYN
jgi:hypothetical protein